MFKHIDENRVNLTTDHGSKWGIFFSDNGTIGFYGISVSVDIEDMKTFNEIYLLVNNKYMSLTEIATEAREWLDKWNEEGQRQADNDRDHEAHMSHSSRYL